MKKKFAGSLLSGLGLMLALSGSVWAAPDLITVTLSSPQTEYIPGQDNTFTFDVGMTYSGAEYVDRYQFVFPAGVTIVSATPASGGGGCGSNAGVQTICGSTVSWGKTTATCSGAFTPSGCGVYTAANTSFTVTAGVPAGFTGPMAVTLNSVGDGFTLPAGTEDSDAVTFAQGGGCTLTVACPSDQTASAPAGASGTVVNFPSPTTGGTCPGPTVACAPASGSNFNVGTTPVTCTATAVGGTPTAVCNFNVTVGNLATHQPVPAGSTFGLAALSLLLLGAAFVTLRRIG